MPTVFISYRQTSESERQRVRSFAERLREDVAEVILDQFFLDSHPGGPNDGWDKWSSDRALQTERVLIVGTKEWFECFDKKQPPGTGLGAACEADDLRLRIYEAAGVISDIRIVLFEQDNEAYVSPKLKRYHRFHADHDYPSIIRWLEDSESVVSTAPAGISGSLVTNIPNNLPRLQFFFGREEELLRIAEALSPEARGWGALIDGPGGIGKTALAIRAAELVPAGRFKRIIFLSSKERELTADGQKALTGYVLPSYLEMLNAVAREIDRPELTKSQEMERPDCILRVLRGSDILLVFDNLETLPELDRDQLFAFLNRLPRGCCSIVTSRRRADASALTVRLDRLDWSAVHDLLSEISRNNKRLAGSLESEWRILYDETGGNPLLLRWVTGQLGLGRCKTIGDAVERLRHPEAKNNPLEFIFGDLLDTFTKNETKVLASLTHFSSPIQVKFIAELSDINLNAAQGALSDLSSRALTIPDKEERSFVLVPMVADFLRRKRQNLVSATGDRLEACAYKLVIENGQENFECFQNLDEAWSFIAAALPLFIGGKNDRLQVVCNALGPFLDFTGRWDERLSLEKHAEKVAVSFGDFHFAGWRAYFSGWVYHLQGISSEVLVCADLAESHWHKSEASDRLMAFATRLRGLGHKLDGNYLEAISAFDEAIELWRIRDYYSSDVSIGLNDRAGVRLCMGDYNAAERDYREALRISTNVRSLEGIAACTGNLAEVALLQNRWAEAELLARTALSYSESIGGLELQAHDTHRLARALISQGKRADALPYARRAVDIYQILGLPNLANAKEVLFECGRDV